MRKSGWILLLIILAAVGLRFIDLAGPSLWDDEMHTIDFASRPVGTMWKQSAQKDSNPIGFYLLLHPWLKLGDGEAFFRAPTALFGVLAVLAFYWLGVTLFDRATGLVAALLAALHPLSIYCSREVRAHTLALLAIIAATVFLVRLIKRGKFRDAVGTMLCLAMALHMHYYAMLIFGGQLLIIMALLMRDARRAKRALPSSAQLAAIAAEQQNAQTQQYGYALLSAATLAHRNRLRGLVLAIASLLGAIVLFLPFFKVFAFQLLRGQSWRASIAPPEAALKSLIYFAYGATPDRLPSFGLDIAAGANTTLLIAVLLLACIPILIAMIIGLLDREKREAVGLALALLLAPALLLAIMLSLQPIFDVRHSLLLMPPAIVLAAHGLVRLGHRSRAMAVCLALLVLLPMGLALRQVRTDPDYARQKWRAAAAEVCRQKQEGDVALAYHEEKAYAFRYYTSACDLPVVDLFDDRVFAMPLEKRKEIIQEQLAALGEQTQRLWLVDYHGAVFDPTDQIRTLLKNDYYHVQRATYDRGVKRFVIDLFTRDRSEAETSFASSLDLTGQFNPGQLIDGWFPPGDKGAWTGEAATALLRRDGQQNIEIVFYVHRPFYDNPVPVWLVVEGIYLTETLVEQTQLVTMNAPLPEDLPQQGLFSVRVEAGNTFVPAEVLDTADRTRKGVLVQQLSLK